MHSLREDLRHAQSLLAVAAGVLLALSGSGCCGLRTNFVNTGYGVDVYGAFEFAGGQKPTSGLVVAVVADCAAREHCYDYNTVEQDAFDQGWHYGVIVPPGDYDLLVFADFDGDGQVGRDDLVGRSPIHVPREATGMLEGPKIQLDLAHPMDAGFHVDLKEHHVPMLYTSLGDRFFDKKWGLRGLAWPVWGLHHTDDDFLFGLGVEPKDEPRPTDKARRARLSKRLAKRINTSKIQVLFVHGVEDTPVAWTTLSALDPARYQPWFFFYPTGLGLDQLGSELADVVEVLSESAQTVLVAHSMGGLVSRRALKALAEEARPKFPLLGYLSLGTPYGGMDSADGMNNIPVALRPFVKRQSLFDVQPDGTFLANLYQGAYPDGLPFYLFWGNSKGDGDGTVTKESATDARATAKALDVCSFNLDHVGLLANNPEADTERLRADFAAALDAIVKGEPKKVCSEVAAK
ncbi:MAG: alpha/beta hydrolase [Myxococcales bacterium]